MMPNKTKWLQGQWYKHYELISKHQFRINIFFLFNVGTSKRCIFNVLVSLYMGYIMTTFFFLKFFPWRLSQSSQWERSSIRAGPPNSFRGVSAGEVDKRSIWCQLRVASDQKSRFCNNSWILVWSHQLDKFEFENKWLITPRFKPLTLRMVYDVMRLTL